MAEIQLLSASIPITNSPVALICILSLNMLGLAFDKKQTIALTLLCGSVGGILSGGVTLYIASSHTQSQQNSAVTPTRDSSVVGFPTVTVTPTLKHDISDTSSLSPSPTEIMPTQTQRSTPTKQLLVKTTSTPLPTSSTSIPTVLGITPTPTATPTPDNRPFDATWVNDIRLASMSVTSPNQYTWSFTVTANKPVKSCNYSVTTEHGIGSFGTTTTNLSNTCSGSGKGQLSWKYIEVVVTSITDEVITLNNTPPPVCSSNTCRVGTP